MKNILKLLSLNLSVADYKAAKRLLKAVKRNCLLNRSSSTSYYLKNFSTEVEFNKTLLLLSNYNLIEVKTSAFRRWSSIEAGDLLKSLSSDKLKEKTFKKEYGLNSRTKKIPHPALTKTPHGLVETGLKRRGFELCCGSKFKLDTTSLKKFRDEILADVRKGLNEKVYFDGVDYTKAINIIINSYINNPKDSYTLEGLSLDSRGRAIFACLKKVGNPVGFKLFRSLLILPKRNAGLSSEAEASIYLFIAELIGYKGDSLEENEAAGRHCYVKKILPKNLTTRLWLLRIYDELERFNAAKKTGKLQEFFWQVPIELDASASMLGIMGVLLNDSSLLTAVNGAGEGLSDPWAVDGVNRELVKAATMPRLFGSSKPVRELLAGKPVTNEELKILEGILQFGYFAKADKLKSLLITGVTPAPKMNVKIGEDEFSIYCNKFKSVGAVPERFTLLDTDSKSLVEITRAKPLQEVDLEGFRRYFPTLLIHCLDSQIASNVAGKAFESSGFCIPIHDAFLVHPELAPKVRGWYATEMGKIYKAREKILTSFFKSINLNQNGYKQMNELLKLVEPLPTGWKCRHEILK